MACWAMSTCRCLCVCWWLTLCHTCTHTCPQREIKILADLGDGHLNIVHADEVLLTRTHVGLVMEYVSGELCLSSKGVGRGACRRVGLFGVP